MTCPQLFHWRDADCSLFIAKIEDETQQRRLNEITANGCLQVPFYSPVSLLGDRCSNDLHRANSVQLLELIPTESLAVFCYLTTKSGLLSSFWRLFGFTSTNVQIFVAVSNAASKQSQDRLQVISDSHRFVRQVFRG
jgi:hypothetical protein